MAASSQVETVGSGASTAKMAAAGLIVVAAIVAFYLLARHGGFVQWVALTIGLLAAAGMFLWSDPGKDFIGYVKDSFHELKKVVWPTRQEALKMTGYVFVFATVMAIFLWLTDMVVGWVIYDLLLHWRS